MDVRFYQLTSTPLLKALPKLLEKIYEQGDRILVLCQTDEDVKVFNEALWTYHPTSFLPHGTVQEGHGENQPIWLSSKVETPNRATVCLSMVPQSLESLKQFLTVIYLFEEDPKEGMISSLLAECQHKRIKIIYWQQSSVGGWVKKDVVPA